MIDSLVFRTSALIYADNNYDIKTDRIIVKIIESFFLETNNECIFLDQLVTGISEKFNLSFTADEILKLIGSDIKRFVVRYITEEIIELNLTDERYIFLNDKVTEFSVEKYIETFIQSNNINVKYKESIYKFLYYIVNNNLKNFHQMVKSQVDIKDYLSEQLNATFTDDEKEIINNFLIDENPNKDKAIFDIICYALEYCLVTGDGKTIYEQGLKNKVLYLDTNIIFRAIGINGEFRKTRTLDFLEKCYATGQQLYITKYTNDEFTNTIKEKIKNEIDHHTLSDKGSIIFWSYSKNYDIISYYLEWSSHVNNPNPVLFESYIFTEFEKLLKKFKITINYNLLDDDKMKKDIDKHNEGLFQYKHKNCKTDAKNLVHLRMLREKKKAHNNKILETPYFIITTDYKVMSYCLDQFTNETILCMLPSYWHTILLKFSSRTYDDYKSFVSFLQLQSNEKEIEDNNKLFTVLSGIDDIVENPDLKEYYAKEIFENGINNIVNETNFEVLHDMTVDYVYEDIKDKFSTMEHDLKEVKKLQDITRENLNDVIKENTELFNSTFTLEGDVENKDNTIDSLLDRIVETKMNSKRNWIILGYTIYCAFFTFFICNLILFNDILFGKIDSYIGTCNSPGLSFLYDSALGIIWTAFTVYLVFFFHDDKKEKRKKKIYDKEKKRPAQE